MPPIEVAANAMAWAISSGVNSSSRPAATVPPNTVDTEP